MIQICSECGRLFLGTLHCAPGSGADQVYRLRRALLGWVLIATRFRREAERWEDAHRQQNAAADAYANECRRLAEQCGALHARAVRAEFWAKFWKRATPRYYWVLRYRWVERCVDLKAGAITRERDALQRRVNELERRAATPADYSDVCGWTEPPPRHRQKAVSVPVGAVR